MDPLQSLWLALMIASTDAAGYPPTPDGFLRVLVHALWTWAYLYDIVLWAT